jgi:hypothetical protein
LCSSRVEKYDFASFFFAWRSVMRIAYWTIDEVNLSLARDLAEAQGATIDQVMGKEKDPTQGADALLYDLDSLPMREGILSCLHLSPNPGPVAVHGYYLEEHQIELLEAQGVAVYRRLESDVIANLCDAVLRARFVPENVCREIKYSVRTPQSSVGVEGCDLAADSCPIGLPYIITDRKPAPRAHTPNSMAGNRRGHVVDFPSGKETSREGF